MKEKLEYRVVRAVDVPVIDAKWDKPFWEPAVTVEIRNRMGDKPRFEPRTRVKMLYDDAFLYLIFQVEDRFVRCIKEKINDAVYEDACVEFFFSPDTTQPERYFNLETNCSGVPLMHYNIIPRKEFIRLDTADIRKIEIAHSLPAKVKEEIAGPVTWTIEYKIPLEMLEGYSRVIRPGPGVRWMANFYKVAEKGSNPHYYTWSPIDQAKPDFHLPGYFGILKFQ